MSKSLLFLYLLLIPLPSYAYIGPGMGGGIVVAVIGFFVAILIGLIGILYYPIKRAFKNKKEKKVPKKESNDKSQ